MSQHHFDVATGYGLLVSRSGLDKERRPRVTTWNQCRDRAGPLGVATQLLVSRPAKRAASVSIGRALPARGVRRQARDSALLRA